MCIAVVALPGPPSSLPITSTCARPGTRVACDWTMLGLSAGSKLVTFLSYRVGPSHGWRDQGHLSRQKSPSLLREGLSTRACDPRSRRRERSCRLLDPDGGVVE